MRRKAVDDGSDSYSKYDKSISKLIFDLYHTVEVAGELYALHEDGVRADGIVTCCRWCTRGVRAKTSMMETLSKKTNRDGLHFKYDPNLDGNRTEHINNVIYVSPIKDTWMEWDYGKMLRHYVNDDGTLVEFDIPIDELSSAEIQSVSPLVVDSKIVKIKSRPDKHLDEDKKFRQVTHKITAHVITMPTSSNRDIYKTMCTNLPRLDVPRFSRTLYFGTPRTYASHVAFQMNQGRNALRQNAVVPVLKGMRQANNFFCKADAISKTDC